MIKNIKYYLNGILSRDIAILSRAITLIESTKKSDQKLAQKLIKKCLPYSGNSIRIGITGSAGNGKSTFINSFGKYLSDQGRKIAILAIDPSSEASRGSILGDKTRMDDLVGLPDIFIRPSPNSGTLGGIARGTKNTIILCEAAGFDTILIETVGSGQAEIACSSIVDFLTLVTIPNTGDEMQMMKRGIMEVIDAVIINKADCDSVNTANQTKADYQNMLNFFKKDFGWTPKTETCSAKYNLNIDSLWKIITEYLILTKENGYFEKKRQQQEINQMLSIIDQEINNHFYQEMSADIEKAKQKIINKKADCSISYKILKKYFYI